ncbi:MAG: hypothetical protein SO009_02795 [Bacilli bacterium]|nr:hypothetical protein [Bacilli bacterium]
MKEYILKDIETVKANLEILPKKTKVNKAKYNEYLEEQLKKITPMIEEAEKEISKRVEQIKKHNTEESLPEERELLDIAKVKRLSSLSSSSNKMNLDYYLYELSSFENNNLEKINGVILKILLAFKEVGIILTPKDFEYSEVVQKYMDTLINDYDNIEKVFDDIYWENSNIITQIELNIRYLYFKHKKEIDKYYESLKEESLDEYLTKYIELKTNQKLNEYQNRTYLFNNFINHTLMLTAYSEKTIDGLLTDIILDREDEDNYLNLTKLSSSLSEYNEYLNFEYIIKDIKELFTKKEEYKGKYDLKLKDITKKEKELFSLNKQINKTGLFKPNLKKINELKLKRNTTITDILSLYIELDELTIQNDIYNNVTNETTYQDILKLTCFNTKYFIKLLKDQIDNLTIEDINQNITNLFEYAFGSEINIISNIAISEEKDIPKIIKDKYRLLNISINEENLNKDDIEKVQKNIEDLIIYYNIKKINLNIQDIDFIFKAEKLKK